MAVNKVEICGVNTAKLPLLTNEEKDALFQRIIRGDKEARQIFIEGGICGWFLASSSGFPPVMKNGRPVSDRLHRSDQSH